MSLAERWWMTAYVTLAALGLAAAEVQAQASKLDKTLKELTRKVTNLTKDLRQASGRNAKLEERLKRLERPRPRKVCVTNDSHSGPKSLGVRFTLVPEWATLDL